MTDAAELVKRLRDPEFFSRTGTREELLAAADEIERLSSTAATLDVMAEVGFSMAMDKGEEARALSALQDGAVSLSADEAYILFLIVDTEARWLNGQNEATNALREKLRPAYREWHRAHPFEVHPHTTRVCEQMQQLRRDEQGAPR